jgi:hypothetical protein
MPAMPFGYAARRAPFMDGPVLVRVSQADPIPVPADPYESR